MRMLAFASLFALSSGIDESFDDQTLSLLQLRATPKHNESESLFSGHPFGCTGRKTAVNAVNCGVWGDVHQHKMYSNNGGPNFNGVGWYWLAKSKDGSFQAQAFVRDIPGWGAVSTAPSYAFKFGDDIVFLDRDRGAEGWQFTYYINGELVDPAQTPLDRDPLYFVANLQRNQVAKKKSVGENSRNHENPGSMIAARSSCFEFGDVSIWTAWHNWMDENWGPYAQWTTFELEAEEGFIDTSFGQCAGSNQHVLPSEILITKEQNDKVCRENKVDAAACVDPDPPQIPEPSKEELCEKNGIEMSHAEDLCADQQAHSNDIYQGCLYDVCASNGPEAEENAAEAAELEAELVNPEAVCAVNAAVCEPCDICAAAVSVDLSNVVQNNLGGLGPDAGAEEIRYKNAMNVNDRKLDVVLTALSDYKNPKPAKNGVTPDGFGRFLMKLKASTDFKFTFEDAETGEAVAVSDVALTFYDMDQAKDQRQRETVSVCGAKEAYTTISTELEHSSKGVCHSFSSTAKGTGKDNPTNPGDITKMQAARSVTYEFHSRASITFSAGLSRSGRNTRPFLFSFKPAVSCGASDAETHCAS